MALGTHPHYRLREGGPVDLVVVSPESRPAEALKKARQDHPGAKVFAYLNTMDLMLSRAEEGPAFFKEREDWFLHDRSGERVRVRVRNYHGDLARYGMNVAHPGYQEWLGGKAVAYLKLGYDGVQLDNVETDYSYRPLQVGRFISALPVEMDEETWYRAEPVLLRTVRRAATAAGFAGREIIFNHMRAGEPDRGLEYLAEVDGANAESWMDRKVDPGGKWGWRARIDLARRAVQAGKRTNLLCIASLLSREEALFTFASYLMTAENDRNTFWYGRPFRADETPWFEFYEADLGRPFGAVHAVAGSGIYRRDFERGVVLVNPQPDTQAADLGAHLWDDAYDEVRTAVLPGRTGAIFLRPEGERPARRDLEAEACLAAQKAGAGDPGGAGGGASPAGAAAEGAAGAGAPAPRRLERKGLSGGAAVEFERPDSVCSIPVDLAPGRYRVIVEGEGRGPDNDAALVRVGGETRRIAFDLSRRQVFQVALREPARSVDIKAGEPWVVVDLVLVVPVGGAP
jgi:hypothetical protein